MLSIERYYTPPNSLKTIERIQREPLKYIIEIAQNSTVSEVLIGAIYFLRLKDKEERVDALFYIRLYMCQSM